jgi:hypothetical protein
VSGVTVVYGNGILDSLLRATAWSEPPAFYVELHTDEPGVAGTVNMSAMTTRMAATFSAASAGSITTSADLVWTPMPAVETLRYIACWEAASGGDNPIISMPLTNEHDVTVGATFTISAGSLTLSLPTAGNTGWSAATSNAILDAMCRSVAWTPPAEIWVKLHTGSPGSAGTNNAATETTRKQATFAESSRQRTANDNHLRWTAVAATESYSHMSYWDASVAGNYIGSDAFTLARPVTAGADFTLAARSLQHIVLPWSAA